MKKPLNFIENYKINKSKRRDCGEKNSILIVEKITDRKEVVVGDIINYKIVLFNNSSNDLINIFVYDLLEENLLFKIGSVRENGNQNTSLNIVNGIIIPVLESNKFFVLTFKVEVLNNSINPINSKTKVNFQIFENGVIYAERVESNSVEIFVEVAEVKIEKKADKEFVVLNDIINYEVNITNCGSIDIFDLIFKDQLLEALRFIEGTFKINGIVVNSVDINEGINIGNLKKGSTITIKYAVIVVNLKCGKNIATGVLLEYSYRLFCDGIEGKRISEKNNCLTEIITIGNNNFKEINIDKNISLKNLNISIDEVTEAIAEVIFFKCKVINTNPIQSNGGQILTKNKAILYGELDLSIQYINKKIKALQSLSYPIRFSMFLILPESYKRGEMIEFNSEIEDIYIRKVNEDCLYVNATVEIKANLSCC
ncbi:MAG: hypothetical protein ACRCTZ_05880 [Sarcina sp.]